MGNSRFLRKLVGQYIGYGIDVMKKATLSSLMLIVLISSSCSEVFNSLSGIVVDAETAQPIEGAIVLIEWIRETGIGDKHTSSVKVIENVTGTDGRFRVRGMFTPIGNPPDITIYKKGYVAWSSRIIFPDQRERTDFKWGRRNYIFRLERFKPHYSYNEHTSFIRGAISDSLGSEKHLFEEAYRWEGKEALREREELRRQGKGLR